MATPSDSPPPARPAGPSLARWLLGGLVVVLVSGFFLLGWQRYFSLEYIRGHLDAWQERTGDNLPLALAVFFVVYVVVTGLSLPVALWLSLTAGFLFGRWLGTVVVLLAATVGATLAFLSSRYLFRGAVQRRFGERLRAINQGVERDGAFYLLTLRLLPVVPYWLINLGMGLTPLRAWTFVWVTLLGILPGTFAYVNAGGALRDIEKPSDILSPGVVQALLLLALLPLLLRLLLWFLGKGRSS